MELSQNAGEVWFLEFSHDGTKLATSGADSAVVIYDTSTFEVCQTLSDHSDSVTYFAWSPDDTKLISCSKDNKAKLWDMTVWPYFPTP